MGTQQQHSIHTHSFVCSFPIVLVWAQLSFQHFGGKCIALLEENFIIFYGCKLNFNSGRKFWGCFESDSCLINFSENHTELKLHSDTSLEVSSIPENGNVNKFAFTHFNATLTNNLKSDSFHAILFREWSLFYIDGSLVARLLVVTHTTKNSNRTRSKVNKKILWTF